MARLFAFLRAINVGGHTVTMDKLRRTFEELGLFDVETFIASGNVMFNSPGTSLSGLERKIAARLEESLGYEVVTFIRTAPEEPERQRGLANLPGAANEHHVALETLTNRGLEVARDAH